MNVPILKLKCRRCEYQWAPRKRDVRICPRCKSTYWNEPKKGNKP